MEKQIVEVGPLGSWECFTLIARMLYFYANIALEGNKHVMQEECNGVEVTGSI